MAATPALGQKFNDCVRNDIPLLLLPLPSQSYEHFSLWAEVIVTCCIAVIGVLGNATAYAVLRRSDRATAASTGSSQAFSPTGSLLRALAAYDVAFLTITAARNVARHYYTYSPGAGDTYGQPYDEELARRLVVANVYLVALQSATLYASAIVVALVTLERHRAVCRPFTAPPSERRTRGAVAAAGIFSLAFYVPKALAYEPAHYCGVEIDDVVGLKRVVSLYGLRGTEGLADNIYYRIIYVGVCEVLIRDFVTPGIVIFANARLVRTMHAMRRRLSVTTPSPMGSNKPPAPSSVPLNVRLPLPTPAANGRSSSTSSRSARSEMVKRPRPTRVSMFKTMQDSYELTRTVTAVVAAAIAFTAPATVVRLTNLIVSIVPPSSAPEALQSYAWHEYAPVVCNLLLTTGASINFFLYVLCARKFRAVFLGGLADFPLVSCFKRLTGVAVKKRSTIPLAQQGVTHSAVTITTATCDKATQDGAAQRDTRASSGGN